MRISKIVSVVLFSLLLSSCVGTYNKSEVENILDNWIGRHESELILRMGAPTSKASDGKDGHILVYKSTRNAGQIPGSIGSNSFGGTSYTHPTMIIGYTNLQFYVNSKGEIYHYRYSSNEEAIQDYRAFWFIILFVGLIIYGYKLPMD